MARRTLGVATVAGVVSLVSLACGCTGDEAPDAASTGSSSVVSPSSAPSESQQAASTGPGGGDGSAATEAYCAVAREQAANVPGEGMWGDPAAVQEYYEGAVARAERAAELAPPEIADAAGTMSDAIAALDRSLAASDHDVFTADLSVLADPAIATARDRVSQHDERVCGVAPHAFSGLEGFEPSAGSLRDQFVATLVAAGFDEGEAGCVFDHLDFADPNVLEGDDAAIAAALAECAAGSGGAEEDG